MTYKWKPINTVLNNVILVNSQCSLQLRKQRKQVLKVNLIYYICKNKSDRMSAKTLAELENPVVHGQWFSDSGHQIITKSQCSLHNGQWIFKFISLWQVKFGKIIKSRLKKITLTANSCIYLFVTLMLQISHFIDFTNSFL